MADVTMVVPSFNRLAALQDTLPNLLAVRDVAEVIVVDDASSDGSVAWLRTLDEPRLRVIVHDRRGGAPAARNTGLDAARTDWVVFGEDDCRFPPDYVEVLRAEADAHGADVVGAPWVLVTGGRTLEQTLAEAHEHAISGIALDQVERFPAEAIRTPFLPALVLLHRRVFSALRYDEGYTGNGYREETDYFVRAVRAGFTAVLTPSTYSWQTQRWPGGQHTARWRYELSSVRNNTRFVRRHGAWLHEQGLAGPPVATAAHFARTRARHALNFYVRPLGGRVKRRLRGSRTGS